MLFFKHSFLNGIYIDLEGNLNYSFILLFDLIDDYKIHKDLSKITFELQMLGEKYPKTKGYTMPALEKTISQESAIDLLSKDPLVQNEKIELANKEENEKNALFQKWNRIKLARKARIQDNFREVDNPVIVVRETRDNFFSLKKPTFQKPIFEIDEDKLSIFEQDTVKSKEMLTAIFSSEVKNEDENSVIKINNDIYLKILTLLLTKESWNRSDLERMCKEYNVLLGSALESINDYSYSLLNEAVIDDDGEKMYIAIEYKEQLLCQNL